MINNADLRLINIKKEDELFYDHKIFIIAWQKSASVTDVARKLGISVHAARQKASRLRFKGIELKRFRNLKSFPASRRKELNVIAKKYYRAPEHEDIDPREFVRVWQQARSMDDVMKHFPHETREHLQGRAGHYRWRYKVPLKDFRSPPVQDKIQ